MTLAERLREQAKRLDPKVDEVSALARAAAILDDLAKWKPEDGYYKIREMQEAVKHG